MEDMKRKVVDYENRYTLLQQELERMKNIVQERVHETNFLKAKNNDIEAYS